MKNIKTSLFLILAVVVLSFTSCKTSGTPDPVQPTLGDLIKGKTYRLGNVLDGTTNVNAKFSGFTIAFNAAGTGATLNCNCDPTTGGSFTGTAVTYTAATNSISFTGTMPSAWPSSVSNVSAGTDGGVLNFNATIGLQGKPAVNYTFNLVKQ